MFKKKENSATEIQINNNFIQYKKIIKIGKQLIAKSDLDEILRSAMDMAIELSGAERGLIALFENEKNIQFEVARNLKKQDIKNPEFEISRTIIDTVFESKENLYLRNALETPQFNKSGSIFRLKILSVICLPLIHESELFGVIYLDNRSALGVFTEEISAFVKEFADFISLAAHNALERRKIKNKLDELEHKLHGKYIFDSIITNDPQMLRILDEVAKIAETDATVLIQGESGTGKELIAKALHFNSLRKDKPFIPINCAAIPDTLLESELFGYVKGAFTGANSDKKGKFAQANGGTIFLDEISELPLSLQPKLLRILQNGEYSPLGSSEILYCDFRIITATNKNLKKLVEENKFREDVYYRLNIIDIFLPPLRERKSDILTLAQHFLKTFGEKYEKTGLRISIEAETWLKQYAFPGNIRELENIIHHAVILCNDDLILPAHLPENIVKNHSTKNEWTNKKDFKSEKQKIVEQFEREYLRTCLKDTRGNITKAAKIAEIQYVSFYDKIKKYGIEPYKYK